MIDGDDETGSDREARFHVRSSGGDDVTDVLSDVLAVTRLKGTVYFSAEFRGTWGIAIARRARSPFYAVTRGRCVITLDGAHVSMGPGDLVVLPGGSAHTLASSRRAPALPGPEFLARYPMDA